MEHFESFGAWLKRRRRYLGLTQEILADCAGCSPVTVRKLESDERRPSRQLAELLADCLQIAAAGREAFIQYARQVAPAGAPALPGRQVTVASEDMPPAALRPRPERSNNLPVPLTSFIGRDRILDDLLRVIASETARPLTLTGAGGSGKTRLALEVAIDAAGELTDILPDGVWWVDLAPIDDGALVAPAVGRSLGLVEATDQPAEEMLATYLATRHLLLILDNCEHLVASCARLSERLLRYCPTLQIMVTSREPFGIPGEVIYPVPTLTLPEAAAGPDDLLESEAARLFVERAAAQRPGFGVTPENAAAIAQICRRLDGIPLALELAAARIKVLSPGQIASRLDDRFALLTSGARTVLPRQQTLRALVDWSYELLDPAERILFRRLGVFVDGWTLAAAEAICADDVLTLDGVTPATAKHPDYLAGQNILDILSRLVDKSLVRGFEDEGRMRYEMLETIAAYAREKLIESGDKVPVRTRHLDYYVNWAEAAAIEIPAPRGTHYLLWIDREYGNLRAVLWRSLEGGGGIDHTTGIRLVIALSQFWLRRNYPQEGGRWAERAVVVMPVDTPPLIQGRLYSVAGTMAWLRSNIELASVYHERALFIFTKWGDRGGAAEALCNLAVMETIRGRMARALRWTEESAGLARESGDRWILGFNLLNLGLAYYHLDQPEAAERTLTETAEVMREVGDGFTLSLSLCALVVVSARLNDIEWAQAYMAEALQLAAEIGDVRLEATAWQSWGKVQRTFGEPAAASFRQSLRLFARTTDQLNILESLDEYAVCLGGDRDPERVAQILGATEVWRERLGLERPDEVAALVAKKNQSLHEKMGEVAYEAARQRGRAMTLDAACVYALEDATTSPRKL